MDVLAKNPGPENLLRVNLTEEFTKDMKNLVKNVEKYNENWRKKTSWL